MLIAGARLRIIRCSCVKFATIPTGTGLRHCTRSGLSNIWQAITFRCLLEMQMAGILGSEEFPSPLFPATRAPVHQNSIHAKHAEKGVFPLRAHHRGTPHHLGKPCHRHIGKVTTVTPPVVCFWPEDCLCFTPALIEANRAKCKGPGADYFAWDATITLGCFSNVAREVHALD